MLFARFITHLLYPFLVFNKKSTGKSYLALQDAEEHVDGNINFYDAIIYKEPSELSKISTRRGRRFLRYKHLITVIVLRLFFLAVTAIGVLIWRLASSPQSQIADNSRSSNAKFE